MNSTPYQTPNIIGNVEDVENEDVSAFVDGHADIIRAKTKRQSQVDEMQQRLQNFSVQKFSNVHSSSSAANEIMHDYATDNCEEEQIYDNEDEDTTNVIATSMCTDNAVFDKVVFSAGRELLYKGLVRQGYYLPDYKSQISSKPFLMEIKAKQCYMFQAPFI